MNPRTNYEMTKADLDELRDARKPTRVMLIGGHGGSSPQENANRAWAALGEKMGFDSMTVRPDARGDRFFTAIPNETDAQRDARTTREAAEKKAAEIARLTAEIADRQADLNLLITKEPT